LPEYVKLFPEAKDEHFILRVSYIAKVSGVGPALKFIDAEIPVDSDESLVLKLGICQQVWKEVVHI